MRKACIILDMAAGAWSRRPVAWVMAKDVSLFDRLKRHRTYFGGARVQPDMGGGCLRIERLKFLSVTLVYKS